MNVKTTPPATGEAPVGNPSNGAAAEACACGRPRLSTGQLFPEGVCEICIVHAGMEYRLRITRQNKLILYR